MLCSGSEPPPLPRSVYSRTGTFSLRPQIIFFVCVLKAIVLIESTSFQPKVSRAGEPANFLAASAPDFFFKRLRLLIFSQTAPATGFFYRAAPAPRSQKKTAIAPDYWLSLAIYSFPRKLVS